MSHDPRKFIFLVGIDPGTATGIALYHRGERRLKQVNTMMIHRAMEFVKQWSEQKTLVVMEDARQVRFATDPNKAQGAGSIKRDVSIWIDFMDDHGIPYLLVRPNKAITKLKTDLFQRITGYVDKTSSHGRDAAMIVFNR